MQRTRFTYILIFDRRLFLMCFFIIFNSQSARNLILTCYDFCWYSLSLILSLSLHVTTNLTLLFLFYIFSIPKSVLLFAVLKAFLFIEIFCGFFSLRVFIFYLKALKEKRARFFFRRFISNDYTMRSDNFNASFFLFFIFFYENSV